MPKLKLTDAAVQRLKAPDGGRVDYFDATFPGFAMRVSGKTDRSPAGRKSWVLFYRFRGEQKRLTLEPGYPALGLADARRRAGDALAMLAEDPPRDPADVKAAGKRAIEDAETVEAVAGRYIESLKTDPSRRSKRKRSPRYVEETKRNFDNHILPRWGEHRWNEISRRDVNDLLDEVAKQERPPKGRNGRMRGGPIAANRVRSTISAFFNWSISRGILEVNHAALIDSRGVETARDRTLSDEEIRVLWPQFEARGYPFGQIFQLALLTGQRRDEVAGMRWSEIDVDKGTWTLPTVRTKSKRPQLVPLSDTALSILKTARAECEKRAKLPKRHTGPFVFSTTLDTHVSGYSRSKASLDKDVAAARKKQKLEPIEPWTIHDLRRTVATKLAEIGTPRFVISRVLNHADRELTGSTYDWHDYLSEKKRALDAWADALKRIIAGGAATATEGVVSFDEERSRRARVSA